MKTAIAIIIVAHSLSGFAQGTFQNLNFEEATPNPYSGPISAAGAIPDWTAEIGGVPQAEIYQNGFSTGAPEVDLITANTQQPPLDGNYSVLLTGSYDSASISQTGLIPSGTQSVFFDAEHSGNGNLSVQIGSQTIPFTSVTTEPNYTVYGANISAWSGQTEDLTFSAVVGGLNNWEIDDISFSPVAIPEPNPFALTGIGGLLFALYRRFAPKRQ
jgi:hypothetical protein